ncbi:DUF2293 domain-containing protein [Notoacmeibacter ruber]|uniref:DUF2293 domain-containing protein n=1 Tax=Notoacmeibacter ruber TaxID=2670375 RepID=A0A3L7JD16_9HYPH|nr:DUF2293 domain-containing protein [Notoacmeibacter ruber]RLQ88205.1 DUF2293 domain-containing protein [Notoacmeibacter ruber]
MARTERQKALRADLRLLLPSAPLADFETIYDDASRPHMRELRTGAAAWLAALAHIRHQYTDYDQLRDEGYDRDSALHFVVDDINTVLTRWRATRLLDPSAAFEDGGDANDEEAQPKRRKATKRTEK